MKSIARRTLPVRSVKPIKLKYRIKIYRNLPKVASGLECLMIPKKIIKMFFAESEAATFQLKMKAWLEDQPLQMEWLEYLLAHAVSERVGVE